MSGAPGQEPRHKQKFSLYLALEPNGSNQQAHMAVFIPVLLMVSLSPP
jgi:hypothetical protein